MWQWTLCSVIPLGAVLGLQRWEAVKTYVWLALNYLALHLFHIEVVQQSQKNIAQ